MMGWDSKASYPPHAVLKVPVRATEAQKWAWEAAAKKHGMASPGAFLAWAGDLYLALQRAYHDAIEEREDALLGIAGGDRRREERKRREREEGER
ncbi:MAG TPA: hypothetical protein VGH73_06285 [Thermoanaerobaculia bacterium]